ncbi:hypothetical protein ABET36_18475 [Caldifermentibacillus hisashii]
MCHMIKNCTIKPKLNLDKVFEVALMNGCGIASGELLFDGISFKDKAI